MNMYIGIIKINCITFAIVVLNAERFEPKFLDRDSYISIFIMVLMRQIQILKNSLQLLKKEVPDITKFKDELFNNLLRGTVNEEKIDLIPFFNGFSDSLTKLYKAVVQISLPNYYL